MKCHEVDYEIFGDDMQIVEVELDPREIVIAETGVMNYMEDGISFETEMGDGSNPTSGFMGTVINVGKRAHGRIHFHDALFQSRKRQKAGRLRSTLPW